MPSLTPPAGAARRRALVLTALFLSASAGSLSYVATEGAPARAAAVEKVLLGGHVRYIPSGEPAAGVTVIVEKKTSDGGGSRQSAVTDGAGHYSVEVDAGCGLSYEARAYPTEVVDGAALDPSNAAGSGGCVLFDFDGLDLTVQRPVPIFFDGYVKDSAGAAFAGVTVTMRRLKRDSNPPAEEIETTGTSSDGHYTFQTWSRCNVSYEFRASSPGATLSPSLIGSGGCILQSITLPDFRADVRAPGSGGGGDAENAGAPPCNSRVGEPVNVTDGNVYFEQTDHRLPGPGAGLTVTRSYNSSSRRAGLFGLGWSTAFDESIEARAGAPLRLNLPDGRAVLFEETSQGSFTPRAYAGFQGLIARDPSGAYTLALRGGGTHRFDAAGRLRSITDRYGNRTTLAYDTGGALASITDPSGRALGATADAAGRVVALADALGAVAHYSYTSAGELSSVAYPAGSGFRFGYDSSRLASVTDMLGHVVEAHAYDARGRALTSERDGGVERLTLDYVSDAETRVTDALGRVTRFFFVKNGGRNLVTRVEGACGCGGGSLARDWTYDAASRVTAETAAAGRTASYTYDADRNLLTATDARGTTRHTYNQLGQVLTSTDVSGATTVNTYDPTGKLVSRRDALGHVITFAYDPRALLTRFTDARSHSLALDYDAAGNLTRATDAAGSPTTFAYDARARLASKTDALGRRTAYEYDAAGRPVRVTRPDGSAVSLAYDLAGRLTAATDARGHSTAYAYDGAGRLVSRRDAAGGVTSYAYDAMSNLTRRTDPSGRATDFEYDEFARPTRVTLPEASPGSGRLSETVSYDAVGNVLRRTDRAGRTTAFEYDAANRPIRVTDPLSQSTLYEYDARSQVTAVTDASGQRYEFAYDALGRLTRSTRAGASATYAYDAAGNLTRRTDYAGAATAYAYDALNRLTRADYPDASSAAYEYDPLSRLTAAADPAGTVRFSYDPAGRLSSTTDVFGQTLAYGYDADGNRTSVSVGGAPFAAYEYDALNRLTRLTDAAGAVVTYSHDALGRQTARTLPNGVTTAYSYDGLGRLTRLTDSVGLTPITDRRYDYDPAGNVTRASEGSGAHDYLYDALDRLTGATHPAEAPESYAYDPVGNRTASHRSAGYAYQPFNRLAATAGASYDYDPNGNLVSATGDPGTRRLVWDARNRLAEVRLPDGARAAYTYDALGRRVTTAVTDARGRRTVTTDHTYDGADVISETVNERRKTETVEYLRGPGTDDLLRQTTRGAHGRPDAYYHLADHQGSTRLLLDGRARVASRLAYDAFGAGPGSPHTRYAYTGRERDPHTGLYHYRARWYDPQLGRFLSEDPIGLAGGINMYTYVSNNPVNRTDPSGLYEQDVHYYLTYFLAMKTGCFSTSEAALIANADQGVDEAPTTAPGYGGTERQRGQNSYYHALHPHSYEGLGSPELWADATRFNSQVYSEVSSHGTQALIDDLSGLGTYLHYFQDTFSHDGFTDPEWGHSIFRGGTHHTDKTAYDVPKAMRMAAGTWNTLNDWSRKQRCGCEGKWDLGWWNQVKAFAEVETNYPRGSTIDSRREWTNLWLPPDPAAMERKRQILGVPLR